jgi:hypothetical protein
VILRPRIAICQPIRASDRTALDITRHCIALRSLEGAIRSAARYADFTFVTVLSGMDDGSGRRMALACHHLAEQLQVPHLLLSTARSGKPHAVNAALNRVWHSSEIALMVDDDVVLPRSALLAVLRKMRENPAAEFICFLKTALDRRYYEEERWTPHLDATYRSFLPPVVSAIARLHPEYFSLVPTGSAYAAVCRGPIIQLANQCNEADVLVASEFVLTGLSVGSWFGSHRAHEVERRERQILDGIPNASMIKPVKATRFLRVPSDLEVSLRAAFGSVAARDIALAIRHTSSIMEDTYDPRTEIGAT